MFNEIGVLISGVRSREKLSDTFGTYPGAVVGRGPDWRFQNQDGGPAARGTVRDIHDWSGRLNQDIFLSKYFCKPFSSSGTGGHPTARSVVSVVWANGEDNMYCRGHKGQVHHHML